MNSRLKKLMTSVITQTKHINNNEINKIAKTFEGRNRFNLIFRN